MVIEEKHLDGIEFYYKYTDYLVYKMEIRENKINIYWKDNQSSKNHCTVKYALNLFKGGTWIPTTEWLNKQNKEIVIQLW